MHLILGYRFLYNFYRQLNLYAGNFETLLVKFKWKRATSYNILKISTSTKISYQ